MENKKKNTKRSTKPASSQKARKKSPDARDTKATAASSRKVKPSSTRAGKTAAPHEADRPADKPKARPAAHQKASSPAVKSMCPVSAQCGACQNLDVPYEKQLERKQAFVVRLFEGAVPEEATLLPILGMEDPFHYRSKVVSPYAPGRKLTPRPAASGKDGAGKGVDVRDKAKLKKRGTRAARAEGPRHEILTGMYAAHSHKLVPTDTCYLENETAKAVTLAIRDLMLRYSMEPYREDTGTGFVRHAVVRVGHDSGEVLVTLVTNEREFPASRAFCRELVRRCPAVTTVVQNVNMRQTNVILGDEERTLYGPGFILDTLCGLSFRISSRSFYQVNAVQTEVLYRRAIELAALTGSETVIDAYCGTGTIGLVAAKNGAARVIGVDSVASAIGDARQNAQHNGIENAEFVAADAADFMRELAAEEDANGDLVLFMDPPRTGASETFLDAAAALGPARIVYISCNPATQARDVEFLAARGYRVRTMQPVDMFPHTDHVENIVLLSR